MLSSVFFLFCFHLGVTPEEYVSLYTRCCKKTEQKGGVFFLSLVAKLGKREETKTLLFTLRHCTKKG
uniref:Putative secreted protein n=1 Tax=Ixodes ricinus TaxID=34613 RepID=A0A6B0U112_IXORI